MAEEKNLDRILKELEKNYSAKKASNIEPTEVISTGIFALDYVLGEGIKAGEGGHLIEFFGGESSGKSTFALHTVKEFQKKGKICAWIDAENSMDPQWNEIVGLDNKKLIVLKPDSLEQMGDMITELITKTDLIVIDSIVSLIPEQEIERDTGQPTMALQARVNAVIVRKIYKAIAHKRTTIIFINQLREKVGVMFGSPITTSGGRSLKHAYHTRIEFRSGKPIDVGSGDKKERIGVEINLKGVKNKKGKPYRKSVISFFYNGSLDNKTTLLFAAIKYGIIERTGAWYKYKEIKAHGQEELIEKIDNKEWKLIEKEIWKRLK